MTTSFKENWIKELEQQLKLIKEHKDNYTSEEIYLKAVEETLKQIKELKDGSNT